MGTVVENKLYKIARKEDSHVNTKTNPDGSKAAIQFTNDGNELNGPVNLIEVDENELFGLEFPYDFSDTRTLKEKVWQEVIASTMSDFLYQGMMMGYDNLCKQIKEKVVPVVKGKSRNIAKDVGILAEGIKAGLTGEHPKALELKRDAIGVKPNCQFSSNETEQMTIRTKEEIEQIVHVMRMSAIALATCIRMLNNSVMADDGTDSQQRVEIQRNLQTLTTNDVMRQIDLLLENKNKELLDEVSYCQLSAFKDGYFLINTEKIPISKYID